MGNRKRGFHRKRENFFRSKLVLNSLKSKVAFIFIVFMFGVVIVLAGMDVLDYRGDLRNGGKFDGKDVNGRVGLSPSEV